MYYILLNPVSQSGQSVKIWKSLERVFTENKIPYKLLVSKKPGGLGEHVRNLTAKLPDNTSLINVILLGGDGTLNEALQGVSDFSKINFGYIPTGSSNDFARDLKLPKNPRKILELILSNGAKNNVRLLDLGELNYVNQCDTSQTADSRYFAVSAGIGFDAAVCEEAMNSPLKNVLNKLKLGKLTYLGVALKQLIQAKSVSCDLTIDNAGTIHLNRFLFIASMLHRYEGGGFKFCPDADASDGIIDLCAVGKISKPVILIALPTAFFGKHYMFPQIKPYTARKIEIKTSTPLWVHTDGEVHAKSDHIIITCRKQAIRFLM